MTCPFCGHIEDKVIDSRESKEGDSIRRRRQCLQCEKRFTTYERIDEVPYMVIKKDGRREKFDRQKVLKDTIRGIDKIAYVRFASVYRDFQDEQAFLNELRDLTRP